MDELDQLMCDYNIGVTPLTHGREVRVGEVVIRFYAECVGGRTCIAYGETALDAVRNVVRKMLYEDRAEK